VESLASFRQPWVFRRGAAAGARTLARRGTALALLILAAGLLPAEGQAGGQASVQASVTIVDTRVGRAALAGAEQVVSELSQRAGPRPGVPEASSSSGSGSGQWSDESGLFSVRLVDSHKQIDTDPVRGALAGPLRLEIQFLAN
jgi:hypothetical protein